MCSGDSDAEVAITRVDDSVFEGMGTGSSECYTWVIQFIRLDWRGLLAHPESLPWPDPYSVQLWMFIDG